ncbi:Anti-sigma regulatory factor (Ser/Thr protein kinase) [Streptosporangium canum]|uniref:Anti-sigma regulatory factor (Ser/Thr protein kinase) n=1 Tax=Streptosporangium canum TaxID=324952 RepID=A0A1I4FRL5_9ACTN|nr:Anti-sigma regulatory factor (Ser/Thr protein kinase) [Streptosporangium canum]
MRPSGDIPRAAHHPAEDPLSRPSPGLETADATEHGGVRVTVKTLHPGSASRRARAVVREALQRAGVGDDDIADAEVIVAELAANAEKHARPPYELRIFRLDGVPAWCEVADGDPDLYEIGIILNLLRSVKEIGLPLLAENGRGLLLTHRLSNGHCRVHPATIFTSGTAGTPGKAVAFALPTRSGSRLTFPCLPADRSPAPEKP